MQKWFWEIPDVFFTFRFFGFVFVSFSRVLAHGIGNTLELEPLIPQAISSILEPALEISIVCPQSTLLITALLEIPIELDRNPSSNRISMMNGCWMAVSDHFVVLGLLVSCPIPNIMLVNYKHPQVWFHMLKILKIILKPPASSTNTRKHTSIAETPCLSTLGLPALPMPHVHATWATKVASCSGNWWCWQQMAILILIMMASNGFI